LPSVFIIFEIPLTDPVKPVEAEQIRLRIYRAMKPERKLEISYELYAFARSLVEASIREKRPDITPDELKREVIRRFSG
jgi:hypothetical protein